MTYLLFSKIGSVSFFLIFVLNTRIGMASLRMWLLHPLLRLSTLNVS